MRPLGLTLLTVALGSVLSCAGDMPVAPKLQSTVTGIIQDRDGNPLGGVRITFVEEPETVQPPQLPRPAIARLRTQTGPDGTFQGEILEGAYRVWIEPLSSRGLPAEEVPFVVAGATSHFEFRYSGVLLSGTATGPGGAPLPGFSVIAYRFEDYRAVSTQAIQGTYELLLQPGRYTLSAYPGTSNGLPSLELETTISDQDTTIDFDFSGHEVRIDVTLFGNALPATHVTADKPGVFNSAQTGIDGEALMYLPDGTYEFRVTAPGDGITRPEKRSVSVQGDAVVPIDLSGVRWQVTVRRSADMTPVPHASVYAQEIGFDRYGSTSTDALGRFQMIVRPGVAHDVWIQPGGSTGTYTVNGVASTSDSTFDLSINVPSP